MGIQVIQGDLFANIPEEAFAIAHVVNDVPVMGSGFVVPLKKMWPIVEKEYMARPPKLGTTQFVTVLPRPEKPGTMGFVANMCAQHGILDPVTNPKPIRYGALIPCMVEVRDAAIQYGLRIICPKFGSLRAGGKWEFIFGELMPEIWGDLEVIVYEVEEPNFIGRGYNPNK